MQRLRALIFLNLAAVTALAEPAEISLQTQMTSVSGNPSIAFPVSQEREGFQQTLTAQSARISSGFRFMGAISNSKTDYSSYSLQDELGNETFLNSQFNAPERSGTLGIDFDKSITAVNLTHSESLGKSPFPYRFTQLRQTTRFRNALTQLHILFGTGEVQQPLSFYTDAKTAERRNRPTRLPSNKLSAALEQIVTSRLKVYLSAEGSDKADRPRSYGGTLRAGYSVTSRDFVKTEFNHFNENHQDPLKDDRGYFSLQSAEVSYSRYLTYDWVTAIGYGLVTEIEDNPQNGREDQFALDVYSVAVNYQGSSWTGGVNLQQQNSNLSYQSFQLGGQFLWNF